MPGIADVTRMRLVGGNLALDFVNTRSGPPVGEPDADVLAEYGDLVSWAVYTGDLSQREAESVRRQASENRRAANAVFARAIRVRDDLDQVFRALAAGRNADQATLSRLRDDASDALRSARLEPGAAFAWSWSDDRSLTRPLWPVVHSAIELLVDGALHRVKQCQGCSFLFVDESKNRSRRWCSMDDCGTDEKMRRYVAARRASKDAGAGPRASIQSADVA
jgi:predicted RNA-binding Zn ribbon-like protein